MIAEQSSTGQGIEGVLRHAAPRALAALLRNGGSFEDAEDAVQEALLAAALQWPKAGVPDRPTNWLITVASRRYIDQVRSDLARRSRETIARVRGHPDELVAAPPDVDASADDTDDTLELLVLCCHPSLTPASQVALTLRAVGGLTTSEVARAFLVPEATMAQRISRAKQTIRASGGRFLAGPGGLDRYHDVLPVLYLMFNEGYTATAGPQLSRTDLAEEAIRLTRQLHRRVPDGEVAGLLALMLLTHARRPARVGPEGVLVPLGDQDRSRWNRNSIEEGLALVRDALTRDRTGPYQLQAAIAALHAEAASAAGTDWPQILALYDLLAALVPNPMVTLNRAVAATMVHGPEAGLSIVAALDADPRINTHHRLHAVRGHLLELAGQLSVARDCYRLAARLTTSLPEQDYLLARAAALTVKP